MKKVYTRSNADFADLLIELQKQFRLLCQYR